MYEQKFKPQTQETPMPHEPASASGPPVFPKGVQEIKLAMNQQRTNTGRDTISYEITEHFGTLTSNHRGWSKEVNMVSWNNRQPRLDIREWNLDHSKMSRGITFDHEETMALMRILEDYPSTHADTALN